MTYIPQVQGHSDLAYFEDLGLIGGSTGMVPLISAGGGDNFPTPDDSYGTAAYVSGNTLKWGAASANSWQGYDLTGGPYTKLLSVVYTHQSTSQYQYLIHGKVAVDSADAYSGDDLYVAVNSPAGSNSYIYKVTSTSWTELGADATIWSGTSATPLPSDRVYGWALYTSYIGGVGSQRLFLKAGATSQWFQILSTADTDTQEFQSVVLWTLAKNQRSITPFYVWGA